MKKMLSLALACAVLLIGAVAPVDAQTQTGFFPTPNQLTVCDPLTGQSPCTPIKMIKSYTVAVTPAQVNTIVCSAQNVTVTGVKAADILTGFKPTATGNAVGIGLGFVSADDTVTIYYCNPTAGNLTPAAGNYIFLVERLGP